MAFYREKPFVIEAITFNEFVEYGKDHAESLVNGEPWHFEYKEHVITQENSQCYLIPTRYGILKFTPDDMLIAETSEIYPCNIVKFEKIYEKV